MLRTRWQKQNLAAKAYAKHMFSLSCQNQPAFYALINSFTMPKLGEDSLDLGIFSEELQCTGGRLRS